MDGKRVLHATEMQSDWHKDYRPGKFRVVHEDGSHLTPGLYEDLYPSKEAANAFIKEMNWDGHRPGPVGLRAKVIENLDNPVPKPPFEGTWQNFALKALVRHAAENGFDQVAWITGEQTKARYDLSKKVESISHKDNGDGTYAVNILDENLEFVTSEMHMKPKEIEALIGKDLTKKIIDGEGESHADRGLKGHLRLSGDDLKVGGEWADNLYNKALPKAAQKMFKKYGAKVWRGELDGATDEFGAAANTLEALKLEPNEFGDIDLKVLEFEVDAGEITTLPPEFLKPDGELKNHISKEDFDQGIFDLRQKSQTKDAWFLEITPEMKQAVLQQGQPRFMPGDAGKALPAQAMPGLPGNSSPAGSSYIRRKPGLIPTLPAVKVQRRERDQEKNYYLDN